ncbi:unnamed protein product [Pleuronectes platessa]|uniref:Uncharacterized protein n=1 Tax=Pleuronectes platessa TaxID=8262 RepID=A0A9N7UWV9_PLEPL|nr:unnamed protein product [Pleuronectes platessa]
MASAGPVLERALLAVRGAAWLLRGICSTCQGFKEPFSRPLALGVRAILGDPLSVLNSFLEPRTPSPRTHLWFLSLPFVRRNLRPTNTDADERGGTEARPARYPLIHP